MAQMDPLNTYQAVVAAFRDFLVVAIHTILHERRLYPTESFIRARKYNFAVRQNRHPAVCRWINDAVGAVEREMLRCSVEKVSMVIHSPESTPLERYVFCTSAFPRVSSSELLTPFAPEAVPAIGNLPEQFRATLARLGPAMGRLEALPADCTFVLALELREEAEAPLWKDGGGWVASEAQPSTATRARTTPVRALEAGAFALEVWVEEAVAKLSIPP